VAIDGPRRTRRAKLVREKCGLAQAHDYNPRGRFGDAQNSPLVRILLCCLVRSTMRAPCCLSAFSLFAFFGFALFLWAPPAATAEPDPPTHEEVLKQAQDLANKNRIDDAAALLEDLRTQAAKENNQILEAIALSDLGAIYERQAKYTEAQSAFERTIFLLTRARGENTPDLIQPMAKLASLLYESGQFSRAESLLLKEIGILNSMGPSDKRTATALAILGKVYLSEHKYGLAEQTAQDSLKVYAGIGAPDDLGAAFGYSLLGAISTQYGAFASAEESLQRALSIMQTKLNPNDRLVGEGIANLGLLYVATGAIEKAEPLLARAHECLEATGLNSSFRRALVFSFADVERRLRHKKKAKELTKEGELLAARSPESTISRYVVDARGYR
jgi:tetratricopeptide (TPR) repeat protein